MFEAQIVTGENMRLTRAVYETGRARVWEAGVMGEPTAPQAQPVEGRSLPTTARGARLTFFDDGGATDAVLAIVTALGSEVWALRERQRTLEAVLADVVD